MKQNDLFRQILTLCLLLALISCSSNEQHTEQIQAENPPAEGFNTAVSDERAIEIADRVMEAMGGRNAWDATTYLVWNFFGRRKHFWNKSTGDIRIESIGDSSIYLLNIHSMEGQVSRFGQIEENSDTLKMLLERGKSLWINDAYWLVMPFKLKDSGVTLKYMGIDTMLNGNNAEVLELTFEDVGKTPENKYLVYVDQKDNLIGQWDFYANAKDTIPRFQIPWADYAPHGQILLSGNRGKYALTDISVPDSLAVEVFTTF